MKTFIQTSDSRNNDVELTIHKAKDLKTFVWEEHVSWMEDQEDDEEELQKIKDDPVKEFNSFNGAGGFPYVKIYELKNDKLKLVFE